MTRDIVWICRRRLYVRHQCTAFLLATGFFCASYLDAAQPPAPQFLYVNRADPTCGGHFPCYTAIQDALNAAQPRATIRIQAETYREEIKIQKNDFAGTSESDRITIE